MIAAQVMRMPCGVRDGAVALIARHGAKLARPAPRPRAPRRRDCPHGRNRALRPSRECSGARAPDCRHSRCRQAPARRSRCARACRPGATSLDAPMRPSASANSVRRRALRSGSGCLRAPTASRSRSISSAPVRRRQPVHAPGRMAGIGEVVDDARTAARIDPPAIRRPDRHSMSDAIHDGGSASPCALRWMSAAKLAGSSAMPCVALEARAGRRDQPAPTARSSRAAPRRARSGRRLGAGLVRGQRRAKPGGAGADDEHGYDAFECDAFVGSTRLMRRRPPRWLPRQVRCGRRRSAQRWRCRAERA